MGLNVVDFVDQIFAKPGNFDISGFANSDLVTPELAERLGRLTEQEIIKLEKRGYRFYWFNRQMTDGIICKWYAGKTRGARYNLNLYFNQVFPLDIQNAKKGVDTNGSGE